MIIVDENGHMTVEAGTLKPVESDHPVYKARVALALPSGSWLYAPSRGHNLTQYQNAKQTPARVEEFHKALKLYLAPYGPQVVDRYTLRGKIGTDLKITKETLNG